MSGYEAPGQGVVLDFFGTGYEGMEITVDSVPMGLLLDVMEAFSEATEGGEDTSGTLAAMVKLLGHFAQALVSWNVTRRGEPVDASYQGLMALDHRFTLDLIRLWIQRTTQASPELGKGSGSGASSEAELTAAAASLSASLPS